MISGHLLFGIRSVAGWCIGEVLAPLTFEGYCDSELVEACFEQELCKVLRAGQVVILDNASFHSHRDFAATAGQYRLHTLALAGLLTGFE